MWFRVIYKFVLRPTGYGKIKSLCVIGGSKGAAQMGNLQLVGLVPMERELKMTGSDWKFVTIQVNAQ